MISTPLRSKLEVSFQVFAVLLCVSQAMVDAEDSNTPKQEFFVEQPFELQRVEYYGDHRRQCICQPKSRIQRGKNAANGMFPYAVYINWMETFSNEYTEDVGCGGTLVTDRHVLTAAQCLYRIDPTSPHRDHAVLQISNIDIYDKKRKILRYSKKYIIHPEHDKVALTNDIALIEFDPPIELGHTYFPEIGNGGIYVRSATIVARNFAIKPRTWLTTIGWGYSNYLLKPGILQFADFQVMGYDKCYKWDRIVDRQKTFCADVKWHSVCSGDAGNGMFLPSHNHGDHILVGINSFKSQQLCASESAVFVNVTEYVDWIHENTMSASCSPCIMEFKNYYY